MKEILIVVDEQVDFVDGALGTKEAVVATENAAKLIEKFEGDIFVTLDTHNDNYLMTNEGKHLPVPHCKEETRGWMLHPIIQKALEGKDYTLVKKNTFGSVKLPKLIMETLEYEGDNEMTIKIVGLCTDICVISNALILKANFPETKIIAYKDCMAGVTPDTHNAAIAVMKNCHIDIEKSEG